ncbi:MAG: low molecular weight protein-tyrosine-phosphatase [Oscillospiraceae bacterium]
MTKILFICHGNICRSPMAEYLLKEMVRQQGLAAQFQIASAATSREEIGNDVYPPARAELRAHGIPVGHRTAVQVTPRDYDAYDWLLTMDENNACNLRRILPHDPDGKIRPLLSFAGLQRGIADPWYTTISARRMTIRARLHGVSGRAAPRGVFVMTAPAKGLL